MDSFLALPLRSKRILCSSKVETRKAMSNLSFWLAVLTILLVIGNVEWNPGPEFQCRHCNMSSHSLRDNASHQRDAHTLDSNHVFYCAATSCTNEIFMSHKTLVNHIWKKHLSAQETLAAESDVSQQELPCTTEGCLVASPSLRVLCNHLIKDHGNKGEQIICPFATCRSGPLKGSSFRPHLSDYHKGWRNAERENQLPPGLDDNFGGEFFEQDMDIQDQDHDRDVHENVADGNHTSDDEEDNIDSEDVIMHTLSKNFFHQLAKFYLKMETECMLPASTVQTMSVGLAHLQQLNLTIIKKVLLKELNGLEISKDAIESVVTNVMCADKMYCAHSKDAPGPTLSTEKLRLRYYKENFKYIESTEINLSLDPTSPKTIQLFSIQETLETLVKCPSIKRQIDKSFEAQARGERNDDVLQDYRDGLVYKRSESSKMKTIDLIIFQDGFNATKDLGSTADKYDTLGMYFVIGNMCPRIRSKLKSMHPVLLIPKFKEMFNTFRNKCFELVVDELKYLETHGIDYYGENIPVVLQYLVGDNKGQNQIGGFVESFTALMYCRFCPMGRDQIRATPWAVQPFRTKETFNEDLRLFKEAKADGRNIDHVNGVKTECIFNSLQEFNTMDPRLCPCLAHDVFEAIINEYDFFPIVENLIGKNWFTLGSLNRRIQKFKYSPQDIRNKPVKVRASKLGGHAVQNWTLFRLFPLVIGKERILNSADPYWQLYLSLKEICEYICAPSITLQQVAYLKGLIHEYMKQRQELLPQVPPKPKHHFISHYADLIVLMGPVMHLFTLRFESAHSFFKRVARGSKNFINIGVTMSDKASLYFCYLSTGHFIDEGFSVQEPEQLNIRKYGEEIENFLRNLNLSARCNEVESARVDSVNFKKGYWILLGNVEDNQNEIIVGLIKCLILEKGEVKLLFSIHKASLWVEYGLYAIDMTCCNYKCMLAKDLKYPVDQAVYDFYGKKCFSLKYLLSSSADID